MTARDSFLSAEMCTIYDKMFLALVVIVKKDIAFSMTFLLSFTDPPQIASSSRNLTVNESFETKLFCSATGNPSPSIQWSLPNGSTNVLTNNRFLTLKNTSRSQHGRYSCKATNLLGSSSTTVIFLNVHCKC